MLDPDVCAYETLDAMAKVCKLHVATYTGPGGFTLEAVNLESFEQYTIHADELMDAVIELGKLLGVDWEDI